MADIVLDGVEKVYPNGQAAAREVDLAIRDGELLVLVGPSGSGKSTVLRMIAGLEAVTAGRILIGGRDVTALPPQERDLAMVFQSYALYPHRTVAENLAFGLRMHGVARAEIERRVGEVAEALGIAELLGRRPGQLSGGQRQRVALGRAIVREPQAFLLDEPLSNLDPQLRVKTRTELARLHHRLGSTMVYVTHDQEEAMTLGDRIAVLRDGLLQQVGTPREVYLRPANVFVGGFIGSPAMNFTCTGTDTDTGQGQGQGHGRVHGRPAERGSGQGQGDGDVQGHGNAGTAGGAVILGIRPRDAELVGEGDGELAGTVEVVELLGAEALVHVRLEDAADGDEAFRVVVAAEASPDVGARVGIRLPEQKVHRFEARTGERLGGGERD